LGCSSDDNNYKSTIYKNVVVYEDELKTVEGDILIFLGKKRVAGI
jgi:hypothetical protein